MPVELESIHPLPAEASALCSRRTQTRATFHRSVSRCTILREPTRSWPRLSHLHGAREEREQFIGLSYRHRSLEEKAATASGTPNATESSRAGPRPAHSRHAQGVFWRIPHLICRILDPHHAQELHAIRRGMQRSWLVLFQRCHICTVVEKGLRNFYVSPPGDDATCNAIVTLTPNSF